MQELEKILEEIEQRVDYYREHATLTYVDICAGLREAEGIIRKHMNEKVTTNDLISRQALLDDFRNTITENSDTFDWLNMIARQPTVNKGDGWIPVEERLPDKEADKFIKEKLDGIGYLYPCLLTYRSPNTERIHVVRFYYDVYERWFVNAGEELCDKDRCIAWRPLPEPYSPERNGE